MNTVIVLFASSLTLLKSLFFNSTNLSSVVSSLMVLCVTGSAVNLVIFVYIYFSHILIRRNMCHMAEIRFKENCFYHSFFSNSF